MRRSAGSVVGRSDNGDARAKDDAGEGAFDRTFAKGEHQAAYHDGNHGKAGEGRLQDWKCLLPRGR